ncbi:hypothetical protein F5Y00DRAFT_271423 [Daldinia vernicosa]|uniref:uncharacterized protein n=1 Tax=Daldinia vernicosa TaxID=114800 RepID=UPI0020080835|nr:uncharacterized protein F5Y00DRAFT_271423 [Daldinia vernicosa]KAI0847128.1 hypothetical protein F5Y00DRAFT_271423 [Daldinia vernicosa]
MSDKSTSSSSVPKRSDSPSIPKPNTPEEKPPTKIAPMPSLAEKKTRFWIEDDKTLYLKKGEPFSLTIKRDTDSEIPLNHVRLDAYRVPPHDDSVEAMRHEGSWTPELQKCKRFLFWKGTRSLTFNNLSIGVRGDFRIKVSVHELHPTEDPNVVQYEWVDSFYSEIIHNYQRLMKD